MHKWFACLAVTTTIAIAAPPTAHAQAWQVRHNWWDVTAPETFDAPTYAEAYPAWALATAERWFTEGLRRDCADFSLSLVIAYAAEKNLPITFRYWHAAQRQWVSASASEERFTSPGRFDDFIRYNMGARNLPGVTHAVDYDEWNPGDMVVMNWSQSDEWPNIPYWHTYLVAIPDELVYYGNLDANDQPTPIMQSRDPERLDWLRNHGDRYGLSPRRWRWVNFRPGWNIPADGVEQASGAVWVTASRLNVRTGPGTGRAVIGQVTRDQELTLTGRYRSWVRVEGADLPNDTEAWISSVYTTTTDPGSGGSEPTERQGTVTASWLNVRTGPGITSPRFTSVPRGSSVTVLAAQGGWLRVRLLDARIGWVSGGYVDVAPTTGEPSRAGTVTASRLNVRSGPGTSHGVVDTLDRGETVDILEESGGWLRIEGDGARWVYGRYVR
jgi:uncharacterized protein YgiM (DUF1202 family)